MGKKQAARAQELLNEIVARGDRRVRFEQLIIEIKRNIGSDMNRTVKPYFALMRDLNMIQPLEENGEKYVIIL